MIDLKEINIIAYIFIRKENYYDVIPLHMIFYSNINTLPYSMP